MIFGSVCSGMEAASAAWHPLGWETAFVSEVDPTASRFLAAKYPTVPNYGDMTKFQEWPDYAIDVLVGGTPCQSFSVAGLRGGLNDARGNLMLVYGAIARRYRPHWLVWENVPGVLSSNEGQDFGSLLGLLTGQIITVPKDGWGNAGVIPGYKGAYGVAWRVLDAQFTRVESHPLAVPQRRRRVFVVGYIGDWRRAAAVLFERESLSGHPPPRRKAGKGIASGFANGVGGGGEWPAEVAPTFGTGWADRHPGSSNQDWIAQKGGHFVPAIQPADMLAFGQYGPGETALTMKSRDYKDATDLVAHTLRANHDTSEDGSGCGTPLVPVHAFPKRLSGTQVAAAENLSPSLGATNPMAVAFAQNQRDELRMMEVAGALSAQAGMKQQTYVQQEWAVRRLTPLECTRLQGFPDDYFDSARLNKPLSDSAKYKMLGNSMAVNVMSWLGRRIDLVDKIVQQQKTR